MTPHEFSIYADAYSKRIENEAEQKRQELYVSAMLISNFVWAKKRPTYEKVFGAPKKKKEMSDEAMLQMAQALNAMFGGTDTRKGVN